MVFTGELSTMTRDAAKARAEELAAKVTDFRCRRRRKASSVVGERLRELPQRRASCHAASG